MQNPTMVARVGVVLIVVALFITFAGRPAEQVTAQWSCQNPFKDAGTLRFSPELWTLTDFCKHSVPYAEIRSGGPPPDGIPPIDTPLFESVTQADEWLEPQSPLIAVEIGGDARAYPLAILIWHEIVNDTVGEVPVAITFCPLCNSAIVFDRRVGDQTLRLGVSGNLRNSDMIMWDSQTESWWQQLTGEAIVGVYTGTTLTMRGSQVVNYAEFAAQYPNGKVLSRQTGHGRSYGQNPYAGYDTTAQPFLFDGTLDPRLPATEHVLAGTIGGQAIAYPFSSLRTAGVINDTVAGVTVVAFWQDGTVSALDKASIDASRPIGTAALFNRTLDGRVLTFSRNAQGDLRDEQTQSRWNVFGIAVEGDLTGKALTREFAAPHFWFAWAAFRPETTVYGLSAK
jgi:hypothetical protein